MEESDSTDIIENKLSLKMTPCSGILYSRRQEAMHKIDLNGKSILVTGSPGFIGANLVVRLLKKI